ncbi:Gti1/Pac2 family protein [Sporobolomyces koalae]|uniref:Gti1/Pac2 family protein n=1 Tax=Sporobolomyces koalae TaxID=500713 RepID=UPI003170BE9C
MEGELPSSGHSYFGIVNSAQEAHAILEASKLGLLPRVTRRLTDEERIRFVRAGAVFVWEEEEAGIRRWTDHIKWSPSRVSGAFLTYSEVPPKGSDTLIKQSFSSIDPNGTKMHLIAYTNKTAVSDGVLPTAARDPLIQGMLARRSNAGRDPRLQPSPDQSTTSASAQANPGKRRQYRGSHPALPPIFPILPSNSPAVPSPPPPPRSSSPSLPVPPTLTSTNLPPLFLGQRERPQSTSLDGDPRPRSASSAYDDRPRTSSSEPRPNSSYAFHHQNSPLDSLPPVSAPLHGVPTLPPPALSSFYSSSIPHRDLPSFARQPFDHSATYPSLPGLLPTNFVRTPPSISRSLSAAPPPPPPLPHPIAFPFDPASRELPRMHKLPPILPMPGRLSPPPGFIHRQNDSGEGPVPSQAQRGIEDERQLRLLGRTI